MRIAPIAVLVPLVVACGDDPKKPADTSDAVVDTSDGADSDQPDGDEPDSDTSEPEVAADEVFLFRAHHGQSIGEGPFPNDGLLMDGKVHLAPLEDDSRFGAMARAKHLERADRQIARKDGFGFVSSVFFPMDAAPDLATFQGKVYFIALSGPEAGARFPGMPSWSDKTRSLSVFPAWGHYLVPGATYGVVIEHGVKTARGTLIEAPTSFLDALTLPESPTAEQQHTHAAFAPLAAHLATVDAASVIGTVFTTEATLPWFDSLVSAALAWPLQAPSRVVSYGEGDAPIEAAAIGPADLETYFGVATQPFQFTPTAWSTGSRTAAAKLGGGSPYTGGSFFGSIGYVVNGSLVLPSFSSTWDGDKYVAQPIAFEDGAPVLRSEVMAPFTAYFCRSHLDGEQLDATQAVPFAIFTHGGTATRADALPFAVANCQAGYATLAVDLPFHGGRQEVREIDGLIATVRADNENVFSGKKRDEAGFVPDGIGDNGSAVTTVGTLFGLASDFDPDILEANLISISVEHLVVARYLRDPDALPAFFGVSVDVDRLVTQSLSFGTSFTSAALTHPSLAPQAVIQSVGSGGMLTLNLPVAPNNAVLAAGIVVPTLGLQSTAAELMNGAWRDPFLAITQWLSQRGDPLGYAPFVLKHRATDRPGFHVLGSGDSWDETLSSLAQLSFDAAWGVPVFTSGAEWTLDPTIPGADTVEATPFTEVIRDNLTVAGGDFSAAYFYNAASCHAQVVTPICESNFQPPYPPAAPRAEPLISVSPICALQRPMVTMLKQLRDGEAVAIQAPGGTCEDLYRP